MRKYDNLPRITASKARRQQLARRLRECCGKYEMPQYPPCLVEGIAARATSTAYSEGAFAYQDKWVLRCIKAGTSSASATITLFNDPRYIEDGTAIWAVFGKLAPVAFDNSLAMVLGQQFASNGLLFEVTSAGTTHASDPAPSAPEGGTHGTVDYVYVGPQTLPIVTLETAGPSGTTLQEAYNSENVTITGCTPVVTATTRYVLASASSDGVSPYSTSDGGGGVVMYQTDSPLHGVWFYNVDYGSFHWVDGNLAAFIVSSATVQSRWVTYDCSGLPSAMRCYKHRFDVAVQYRGVYATGADTVRAAGMETPSVISIADSFAETTRQWTAYLGDLLGIDNHRISGRGGTGVLWPNTGLSRVNYVDRLTQDVIDHNPDVVLIQLSGNDGAGVSAEDFTVADVADALGGMLDRLSAETNAEAVVVGVWNSQTELTSGTLYDINTACAAVCAAKGVPFIDWSDLMTPGGYIGGPSGTGNSKFYTRPDGIHPSTPYGDRFRADFIAPRLLDAVEGLAG